MKSVYTLSFILGAKYFDFQFFLPSCLIISPFFNRVLKDKRLSEQPLVRTLCDYLYNQHVPSSHLLSTMVEIYEEEAEKGNNESLQSALEVNCIFFNSHLHFYMYQYLSR